MSIGSTGFATPVRPWTRRNNSSARFRSPKPALWCYIAVCIVVGMLLCVNPTIMCVRIPKPATSRVCTYYYYTTSDASFLKSIQMQIVDEFFFCFCFVSFIRIPKQRCNGDLRLPGVYFRDRFAAGDEICLEETWKIR